MKVFEESFKQNRRAALKTRGKELSIKDINNTKIKKTNNYTNSKSNDDTKLESKTVYKHLTTTNAGLMDADSVSESFEKDARRYSANFNLEIGGDV